MKPHPAVAHQELESAGQCSGHEQKLGAQQADAASPL